MIPDCKKILLLGAGGHCLSVIDSIRSLNLYDEVGIIERSSMSKTISVDRDILGIPIVGIDDDLERLYQEGYQHAFVTVGSMGDVSLRKKLYERIKAIGFHIPTIVDGSSKVSEYSTLGEGIYVGKNVAINACVTVDNMAIINTGALVEHECHIGNLVHLAPGSILCGHVQIGDGSHIGAGTVIKQGIRIGKDAIIGMGSVVLHDIGDNIVAYGNPCKEKDNKKHDMPTGKDGAYDE